MQINYTQYKNFGKVYEIKKDEMVVRVTVDIGPRIIYFGTADYNFMYEDIDRILYKEDEFFEKNYSKGRKWFNLGGHRLWKSPEDLASYSIDDTPVKVIEKTNGAIFAKDIEKTTGLIKEFEIEILENNRIKIDHRFTNTRSISQEVALWALTVLRPNGKVIVPVNNIDKGLLPSRNYVYWSYSKYDDERFEINENAVTLQQSQDNNSAFKFGMFAEKGVAGYLEDEMLFIKTFDVNPYGNYPDMNCNFESYTNEHFLECETLGEIINLRKNETSIHTEVWEFMKIDKLNINEVVEILLSK